ncbi:MAG TPA: histidine triad nucleotide-binding protein [Acidobacteriaceae bacterium]|nr:histidine triad nucleotide-binding protein [Acidobacteriaceae bacterium]
MNCLFCRIVSGEIPAKKIFEDEVSIAFADINPQAPTHFLVIPKKHIDSLAQASQADKEMLGHLTLVAAELAKTSLSKGFRIVINSGEDGGQTVDHLHLHVLGGRPMHWPPG